MEHMTSERLFIHKLPVSERPYYKKGCQFKSSLVSLKYTFKYEQADSRSEIYEINRIDNKWFCYR